MNRAFRPATPTNGYAIDCNRAVIAAQARSVATVLSVHGQVDVHNAETVYRHLRRFDRLDSPLILDVTDGQFADLGELRQFLVGARGAGDGWYALVGRPETVAALCEHVDGDAVLPFGTVVDAVQHFVRILTARRDPGSLRLLRPA
ncbi:MAG: hypothetical protein ABWY93_34585 [Mycobacterium sp.]